MNRWNRATLVAAVIAVGPAVGAATWVVWPLPAGVVRFDAPPGVRLEDRSGIELRSTRSGDGSLRRWVPLAEMDPALRCSLLLVRARRKQSHSLNLHSPSTLGQGRNTLPLLLPHL